MASIWSSVKVTPSAVAASIASSRVVKSGSMYAATSTARFASDLAPVNWSNALSAMLPVNVNSGLLSFTNSSTSALVVYPESNATLAILVMVSTLSIPNSCSLEVSSCITGES